MTRDLRRDRPAKISPEGQLPGRIPCKRLGSPSGSGGMQTRCWETDRLPGAHLVSAKRKVHRVTVNFSASAYGALEQIAASTGKTISEVLRDAIALEKWFHDVTRHGGRVLVEENGQTKEIVPR